ncbi:acriflavin resistance protein [Hominisplanchenecus murintestinalis]|uniref:Acriflavin resistance protein n=1 Tax=Hominisplanchenecus murintestinalis TaxID=2941517 RepID=A0AC61QZT6_9FIRM|nr:efflux RND transporter permease subunit [Hominisplanchenecus murintestinalis]TGX98076.1 acriflavin resistance protein [Hominisplanchenecus murintestinalis]
MIAKFSVKRPYTVVVGMVLVLVLGFVSFSKMKTDLLPDMTLPYALVYTTYIGASPEEVETTVTRPVEQSMATISNIENITSVSSENVSMVVLEFAQTVNMDAVTIEMRESLDQIKGYWDDSVGSPIIMKMNPDMLPVMVAAAEAGDMEGSELTDYVNNTVLPELESIEGVASVTASGLIDEEVRVIIRQDKIDAVNRKVKDALDGKFAEAESEMEDAKAELEDGKTKLEEGERALAEQTANAESQISSGQNQLISGEAELNQKIAEVESGLAELETAEKEIQAQEAQLAEAEEQLDALPGQLTEAEEGLAAIESGITGLEAAAAGLEQAKPAFEGKAELEKQLDEAEKNPDTPPAALAALRQQLTALQQQLDAVLQPLAAMGIDTSGSYEEIQQKINTQKSELISQKTQMETAVGLLREMAEEIPNQRQAIAEGKKQIRDGKKQIKAGKSQLTEAKQQLTDAKSQIESGKISLSAALSELNRNKISATIEIASGKAQITAGESQLDTARKELDSQKDAAYEKSDVEGILTADMIKGILAAQNFTMPAGYVAEEGIDFLVRVGDKLTDTQSLEDLMLVDLHMKGLKPIYLSDVADVTVTDNSSEVYAKINGHAGVLFSMQKQSGYSTGDVSKRIQKKFTEIEEESGNTHFVKLMDQGIYIDMVVNSVLENMISGAVLAVLILLLFLKSVRPTVVIAFSIPISILAAIVLMYFSGININIISLSGLALGIGMLVDNSIVVIENIYRLRNEGVSAKKAAVEGARQVAGAIAASTLTTICVFLPIVFTEGITRQLFVDMGLTIAYSLLASLAVALTVVPMMGSGLLKNTDEKKSRIFGGLQSGYGKMIGFALNHRAIVLIGAVLALVLSAVLSVSKGTEFMPEMESTQMSLTLSLPDEGAGKQELAEMSDKVTERIQDIPDVEEIGAMSQGGGMMGVMGDSGSDTVSMYLILKEDKELDSLQLAEEIKERTADLACELNIQTSSMDMSALGGSGISVKVKGRELDTLKELAAQAAAVLETVEGAVDVSDGIEEKTLEMRIVVDKDKAMKYQLTTAQVFQFLQGKLADAKSATTLTTDVKDYPVMVISENDTKLTREQIKKLKIEGKDKNGNPKDVPLKNIVEFQETEGFSSINREAQTRYVTVSAKVDAGYNIGLVAGEAEQKLKEIELPKGYTLEMSGENETINESMVELLKMLGLAVLLIYLIMVAQFQSLLSPFIIMFTIPLAFTGGFLGLWATGKPVSVIAMIGFVMLSGIIVNNGIVLVDYINQLRRGGMEKRAAIIESGRTRLRPILMTALTTILGLSTMAVGLGMGADMVQPMAIVAVGGLLYGTLLTLVVVPCIYDLLNRKKDMTEEEI